MPRFFTYSWQYSEAKKEPEGAPLIHAAGSKFTARGIDSGDIVYVTCIHNAKMLILGRLEVGVVVGPDEAQRLLGSELPYRGEEHLIARSCTPARLTEVPSDVARELRFTNGSRLAFRDDNALEPQTLRTIRELDAESAARLDAITGELHPAHLRGFDSGI